MFPVWRVGIFTAVLLAAACGGSGSYCPGLCSIDSTHPTMSIEVAGGAAVFKSAEVLSGPCSRLLVQSSGEAGAPAAYAAVHVTYNGPTKKPLPLCTVRVTFVDGQQADVSPAASVSTFEQACCPSGTCCAKAQAVTVHQAVTFAEAVHTLDFSPLDGGFVDGGAGDAPMLDAETVDGGALDGEGEIDSAEIDAASESVVDSATGIDLVVGI